MRDYGLYELVVDKGSLDKELLSKIEELEEKAYREPDIVTNVLNGDEYDEEYEEIIRMAKEKHGINLYAIYNDPDESSAEYTGLVWCMELELPENAKAVGVRIMTWCAYS